MRARGERSGTLGGARAAAGGAMMDAAWSEKRVSYSVRIVFCISHKIGRSVVFPSLRFGGFQVPAHRPDMGPSIQRCRYVKADGPA